MHPGRILASWQDPGHLAKNLAQEFVAGNGSVLISQSHFKVQSTNTFTSLTISPLGPGDSGTYMCTAFNNYGVFSASIQLIVQSKLVNYIHIMMKCTCVSYE